jgi:membrane-bound lytic murein transglycosylase A
VLRFLVRALAAATMIASVTPARAYEGLGFDELHGWAADDHAAARDVFRQNCDRIGGEEWRPLCRLAQDVTEARSFFELFFGPVLRGRPPALSTGYDEPDRAGSRVRTGRFVQPIYRSPPELTEGRPWLTRMQIEDDGAVVGRGLEIAWLADPVDVFFLHIQGSGRIRLTDGSVIRVGFAGKNNHPYRSVGEELVRRGIFGAHEVSAQRIRSWVRRNPVEGAALLQQNPSYVFFREVVGLEPERGPIGAMGRPITAMRSIAVDPDHVPPFAPVWIAKAGVTPLARLTNAQDSGGAIRGAQRADIVYGSAAAAGEAAGIVRDPGRMVTLLPIDVADTLSSGF